MGQAVGHQVWGASDGDGSEGSGSHCRKAHLSCSCCPIPAWTWLLLLPSPPWLPSLLSFACTQTQPKQYCQILFFIVLLSIMVIYLQLCSWNINLFRYIWPVKFIDVYLVLTAQLHAAPDICCLGFLNSSHCCSILLSIPLFTMCILTPSLQIRIPLLWPFKTFFPLNSHCGHQPYTIQCTGSPWNPRCVSGTPNMEKAYIPFLLRCLQCSQLNERGCY